MRKMSRKLEGKKGYPWLDIGHSVDRYVGSEYYDKLLKDYVFQGRSDLQHFHDYLKGLSSLGSVLELGAGNGRATKVFLDKARCKKLTLVDLSSNMLNGARDKFQKEGIHYVRSDMITYISKSQGTFDFIYTLWSFSHSVHQHLDQMGLKKGRGIIKGVLEKMVRENMHKGSKFYLVHFDSLSDEQRILMKQWRRKFPIFRYTSKQSPSKRYVDEALGEMKKDGMIRCDTRHYEGEAIRYDSMDEALEIFMNFHLESFFNRRKLTRVVLEDIEKYLKRYQKPDGTICVKPGCFIYSITKII